MLSSIITNDFIITQIILIIEFIIWIFIFLKLRKWIKPIKIKDNYITFASYLALSILIAVFMLLIHFQDYYHDQSFIKNGNTPPFKLYTEVVSGILAFLYSRIDWEKVRNRFLRKHKIILTEDEESEK